MAVHKGMKLCISIVQPYVRVKGFARRISLTALSAKKYNKLLKNQLL
jgi:hypothetical protein